MSRLAVLDVARRYGCRVACTQFRVTRSTLYAWMRDAGLTLDRHDYAVPVVVEERADRAVDGDATPLLRVVIQEVVDVTPATCPPHHFIEVDQDAWLWRCQKCGEEHVIVAPQVVGPTWGAIDDVRRRWGDGTSWLRERQR